MAGLPPANQHAGGGQQPCLYNDPSVYVKTEYDQGKTKRGSSHYLDNT